MYNGLKNYYGNDKLTKEGRGLKYTYFTNSIISYSKKARNYENYMESVSRIISKMPKKTMTLKYAIKYAGQSTFKQHIQYEVTLDELNELEDIITDEWYKDFDIREAYRNAFNWSNVAIASEGFVEADSAVPYTTGFKTYNKLVKDMKKGGYDPNGNYIGK